jgi:hypothetical protein
MQRKHGEKGLLMSITILVFLLKGFLELSNFERIEKSESKFFWSEFSAADSLLSYFEDFDLFIIAFIFSEGVFMLFEFVLHEGLLKLLRPI